MLEGEINVGDRLIWEPESRTGARERVVVIEVKEAHGGDVWIRTDGKSGKHWNEEDRVREACVRDLAAVTP